MTFKHYQYQVSEQTQKGSLSSQFVRILHEITSGAGYEVRFFARLSTKAKCPILKDFSFSPEINRKDTTMLF